MSAVPPTHKPQDGYFQAESRLFPPSYSLDGNATPRTSTHSATFAQSGGLVVGMSDLGDSYGSDEDPNSFGSRTDRSSSTATTSTTSDEFFKCESSPKEPDTPGSFNIHVDKVFSHSDFEADLRHWAPETQVPAPGSGCAHLPDLTNAKEKDPTSLNIGYVNPEQKKMEQNIMSLLSMKAFEDLLEDPLARQRFRTYLSSTNKDVGTLDNWSDLRAYRAMRDMVKTTSIALQEIFATPKAANPLTAKLREDMLVHLKQGEEVGESLEEPQQALLHHLYQNEFQNFIQYKLIKNASTRLADVGLSRVERKGLGESFCLTNPRLRDHPIVLVSPAFEQLTGYKAKQIVGRNCRMLAGPATNATTSRRIASAIVLGEGINTLIMNYRSNGEAFWNLLSIIPLRDPAGEVVYFIGGQTEVNRPLEHLPHLMGSQVDTSYPIAPFDDISPTMKQVSERLNPGRPCPSRSSTGYTSLPASPPTIEALPRRTSASSASGEKRGMKSFLSAVGAANRKRDSLPPLRDQRSLSAEPEEMKPLISPIVLMADMYSKIVVFKRHNREIMFCSPDFLSFCDRPSQSPYDVYCSSLLHADLLTIVGPPMDGDSKSQRRMILDAISEGRSLSVAIEVTTLAASKRKSRIGSQDFNRGKSGVLHLSPLTDKDGHAEAFVAIVG